MKLIRHIAPIAVLAAGLLGVAAPAAHADDPIVDHTQCTNGSSQQYYFVTANPSISTEQVSCRLP